ncbi:MAG: hypothetical protein A2033_19155 [Bacteroidetes bacterium GWA2_31_9]|nr:MAG: hypothetical protein A2033_19155 [Bacteroidetes bacterium GWA2_31_9]
MLPELTTEKEKLKNTVLARRLFEYLEKENKELFKYLYDKGELKEFVLYRSNAAHDEYISAFSDGMYSPDEVANQQLFIGIENSYFEYIESLVKDNFYKYFKKIEKKPSAKYNEIISNLVFDCMEVFYEYISCSYIDVMDSLDRELITALDKIINIKN